MEDSEVSHALKMELFARCDVEQLETVESKYTLLQLLSDDFLQDLKDYLFEQRMMELDVSELIEDIKQFCEESKDEYSDSSETATSGRESRCSFGSAETESD